MFVGTHERQLDDKGRLALPATFRGDLQGSCYLSIGDDRCITVFTAAEFEDQANDMLDQVRAGRISQNRLRAVAGAASLVAIDKQGRITIDEHLRRYAELRPSTKVIVRGAFDHGEIWCEEYFRDVASAGEGRARRRRRPPQGARMIGGAPLTFEHQPVMRDEVVAVFTVVPPGTVVDATVGGGGHSEAILDSRDDLWVLGIDRDPSAVEAASRRLERFGERATVVHRRFDQLADVVDESSARTVSGALFDLGVSSPQLDRPERGFSYQQRGPIDMRMDTTAALSADDVVNGYEEARLALVLRRYGDERYARRIAAAIVRNRPIGDTAELASIIATAIPAPARRRGGHPAKRSFQAIRVEVNGELSALTEALDAAIDATAPGGRIAVLSYHSGEDRLVKERFRAAAGACDCPPGLPCVCGARQTVRLVRGISRAPTDAEVSRNRRAASARLRVVERVEPPAAGPVSRGAP